LVDGRDRGNKHSHLDCKEANTRRSCELPTACFKLAR